MQTSSANLHHAKVALAQQKSKLASYRTELQVLKRLRYVGCSPPVSAANNCFAGLLLKTHTNFKL